MLTAGKVIATPATAATLRNRLRERRSVVRRGLPGPVTAGRVWATASSAIGACPLRRLAIGASTDLFLSEWGCHAIVLSAPYPSMGRASLCERPASFIRPRYGSRAPTRRLLAASTFNTIAAPLSPAAQPVAAAPIDQLLNQLDDEAHAGRALRVTVDQRRAVVVERVERDVERAREVDVIDGERVVGLDHSHVVDAEPCVLQGLPRCGHGRHRHVGGPGTGLPIADHLDLDARIATDIECAFTSGQDHGAVAVSRVSLAAVGDAAALLHRLQPGQALCGCRGDALVVVDGGDHLAPGGVADVERADHVPAVEAASIPAVRDVLLVSDQRHLVLL